ncbi:DUF6194 family protein [Nocardia jiangxiensis]|uniref:DUF6194 family protein n=1 Tax=Nocardia jiangxiensis TaxID=282685 RepID=A0ABW6RVF0_9NOCA|nr:DUF6194 family protein [Nocardia jiangxiensis]
MTPDGIIEFLGGLDNVLTMRPGPGDGSPEISWGDTFFYYTGDGSTPSSAQPFATIVTKNYPGDEASHLDRPGAFRVNIAAGRAEFTRRVGRTPREIGDVPTDYSLEDAVLPHPVYGSAGWLAVVNPGSRSDAATRDLLRAAHARARAHHERDR